MVSKRAGRKSRRGAARTARYADQIVELGTGGEPHQTTPDSQDLTTQQGTPIAEAQNTLRAGARGPALLEDFHLIEKLMHFDHERVPERVVFARGYGAHGFFENYEPLADVTRADLFQRAGDTTPVFVRFSALLGSCGSGDLARDVRGFAVKFYTRDGNWDLVGTNLPVFFVQDAVKFPDLVHAAKQEPDRGFPQAATAHDNFWDFVSLMPESLHMILWLMSDRALPRSYRFMEGFGVHTFRFIDRNGTPTFVKFHWKPKLGPQSVVWDEAVKINGADPDFHRRDLWTAIQNGDFPEWELGLQLFDEDLAGRLPFDVLDPTKLIAEEDVPLRRVGRLVLNRCVENFFAETDQAAFCPQNVVPGIDLSSDPVLQGRGFAYLDSQTWRLGSPNFSQLPINAPQCPFRHFQQDGPMALFNPTSRSSYEPNSRTGSARGPREAPDTGFHSYPEPVGGTKTRKRPEGFADHYSQARQFYASQTPVERRHVEAAFVSELGRVQTEAIRARVIAHLLNVDERLAKAVAAGLRLHALPERATSGALSAQARISDSAPLSLLRSAHGRFAGRTVGVLLSDGADLVTLGALESAFAKAEARLEFVSQHIGGVEAEDGTWIEVDQALECAPSVFFDAVALIVSAKGIGPLDRSPAARAFVADAFAHCKYIAYTADARSLLDRAALSAIDAGCFELEAPSAAEDFAAACANLRFWQRELAAQP